MPLYMSTFDYEPEVWAELVNNPENRTETVSRMLEDAGCKLKGLWYAFGRSDGFALIEAPDQVTSASISIAISASGTSGMKWPSEALQENRTRTAPLLHQRPPSPRQDPPSGRAGGGSSPRLPDASVGQFRREPGPR